MLECNSGTHELTLNFPKGGTNADAHLLWMSNLFVGPNPTLDFCGSYLSAAATDYRPMITNILLMWHTFLGGHVEEETF